MKITKHIGFILILIFILCLLYSLFIFISYQLNKDMYKEVAPVQGNKHGYVPQGLTYSEKYNVILQTSYNTKKNNSMLFVIDFESGECLKKLIINKKDGTKNTSHAGGIATNDEVVWITSDYEINKFSLEEIITTDAMHINSIDDITIKNRGDFCTYNNGILWVGEFKISTLFNKNNDMLVGFEVDSTEDYDNPKYNYSLPSKVQGMAVTNDGKFIFSRSYTGFIQSKLSIYDMDKKITSKMIPSMAEGIFIKDDDIYILFESSTDSYKLVYPKIKNIIKIKL